MRHDRLVSRIERLHRWAPDPFGLFVTEALRSIGLPVAEPGPEDDDAVEAVHEAVAQWLAAAAMEDPFVDVLGPVYSEVASRGRRERAGQFFTPWELALMTAELTLGKWEPRPHPEDPDGRWRILEPACGSGAMLLAAFAHIARRHGPDALRLWYAQAWDIDLVLARTCALQIMASLMMEGWTIGELVIVCGDSLRLEPRRIVIHASAAPEAAPPTQSPTTDPSPGKPPTFDVRLPAQLSLFDGEAAA